MVKRRRCSATNYYLFVEIDRYARVHRTFHVGTELPSVQDEWKKIMESHLDAEDIVALDELAAKEKVHDCYLRKYASTVDKSTLKRSDLAGGRNRYKGYKKIHEGDDVIFVIITGS